MKCPVCKDVTLLMSEKKGVEIDYCPECRGIWLDRGELEKLIEQEERYIEKREEYRRDEREDYRDHRDARDYHDDYREHGSYHDGYKDKHYPRKRRKESFMGEIFDIFGD